MGVLTDLTNQTFDRLTVVQRANDYVSPQGKHIVQWLCKCSCGNPNYITIAGSSLKRGLTKSCGCLQKEKASKIGSKTIKENGKLCRKYNVYDLSNEYGVGYAINTNKPFYFDLDDYENIKDYCWRENRTSGYIVTNTYNNVNLGMHRLVMHCPAEMVVDHINHNRIDNRKINLRICTVQQNNCNLSIKSNNTSGYTGVSWSKHTKKWHCYIEINGKRINLGYFNDINKAIEARQQAEIKYFGKFRHKTTNE